jgi:hypothetical protein
MHVWRFISPYIHSNRLQVHAMTHVVIRQTLTMKVQLQSHASQSGTSGAQSVNPLMPELNPSAQRCLMKFFTGDFASWTVHFLNVCVKNQQMQKLFIQFINYVRYLLHVSALHYHPRGAFLVPSERCSRDTTLPSTIFYRLLLNWASLRRHWEHSLKMAM